MIIIMHRFHDDDDDENTIVSIMMISSFLGIRSHFSSALCVTRRVHEQSYSPRRTADEQLFPMMKQVNTFVLIYILSSVVDCITKDF